METRCEQCGAPMSCHPEGGCWCAELGRVPVPTDAQGCICPNCLRAKIAALRKPGEREEV